MSNAPRTPRGPADLRQRWISTALCVWAALLYGLYHRTDSAITCICAVAVILALPYAKPNDE